MGCEQMKVLAIREFCSEDCRRSFLRGYDLAFKLYENLHRYVKRSI
jgi:hypothetical protein